MQAPVHADPPGGNGAAAPSLTPVAKRIFDLFFGCLGLLLLGPAMLLVALAIKLDTPGPVFFRQQRVGLNGRTFRIHKFRTMVHEPGSSRSLLTLPGRSPVTRVGAWLRRTKVDELAQLIDVVGGQMSLVGPRPEVPRYVAHYPEALRSKLLSVRPGITDLASIEFRNEGELLARASDPEREYLEVVMPAKLALSARYVDQATLWLDIRLILRTVARLAGGRR